MVWRHRSERYTEKLATPDTSVGDLVGDVDPVKVAQGRTLGDPETVHYGLVPRANRGVFGLNELPDLAERIQVAMFNVLEERDIQIRGYSLRLPLDLLLVATANPEDYTNRGRIITPLKDRFGAEIRTHYQEEVADEVRLIQQEAQTVADVPEHLVEVLARFTRGSARVVRGRPAVRGLGAVLDRGGRERAARPRCVAPPAPVRPTPVGPDLRRPHGGADAARQGRVRDGRGGSRARRARPPAAARDGRDLPGARWPASTCRGSPSGSPRATSSRPASWCPQPTCSRRSARPRACPRCSTGSATATTPVPARSPRPSSSSSRACTSPGASTRTPSAGRTVYGA